MTAFVQSAAAVVENVRLAHNTYRIRLHYPELARLIRPGQFVMLRLPGRTDPLLGRPFALYDTVLDEAGQPVGVDVVYLVVGKMTGLLAEVAAGERVEVWGPLGNGFPDLNGRKHVGLVAGGIGQTPFLAHVRDLLGGRGYGGRPAQAYRGACISLLRRPHRRPGGAASRISARPGPTCISPATTAASASTATSRSLSNGTPRRRIAWWDVGRNRCCTPWRDWRCDRVRRVTSRWRRRWRAASVSASAA